MKIGIDQLELEAELIDLNNRIVARLRFLQQMRACGDAGITRSAIGSPSSPPGHGPVEGMLDALTRRP